MDFELLAAYANYTLTWIGFGTLLGLGALLLVPGKDQGGAVATVLMGIAGTLIGCAILQYFAYSTYAIQPCSFGGFFVGAGGASVLLAFYKVLGGHLLLESEHSPFRTRRRRRRFTARIEE